MTDCVIFLGPEEFDRALAGPARVKLCTRRVPPFVVIYESPPGRVAVFRTIRSWHACTPILNRIDIIDRVRAWPVLGELLSLHTPKPRPKRKEAPIDAAAKFD